MAVVAGWLDTGELRKNQDEATRQPYFPVLEVKVKKKPERNGRISWVLESWQ
jgi:hypothetical protein